MKDWMRIRRSTSGTIPSRCYASNWKRLSMEIGKPLRLRSSAKIRPYVFLTSNRTREIHDALKRRCLYHWIEYPTFEKEYEIITTKFPEMESAMAKQICAFMQRVRQMNFYKRPGVAETLDWASALIALNRRELDDKSVVETMGCVFKYREDLHHLKEQVEGKQLNLEALLRVSPELVT